MGGKIAIILLLAGWAHAYTGASPNWTTDGSQSDVQAAHDDAGCVDGDTITLPSGSFNWVDGDNAPGLNIIKNITIKGNGVANTTIVIDDGTGNSDTVIETTNSNPGVIRFDGINFTNGTATEFNVDDVMRFNGTGYVVVERCDFTNLEPNPNIWVDDSVWGVLADCNVSASQVFIWFFNGKTLRDGTGEWGDDIWTQDVDFGGESAFYLEDCTFTSDDNTQSHSIVDTYGGSQHVIRYCTIDGAHFSSHGTGDGSGRSRGPRKTVMHDLTFVNDLGAELSHVLHRNRGGPGLYYNWNISDYTGNTIALSYYRFRSPHGKHLVFPTLGVDQWTVQETGNTSTDPSTYATLTDSGIGWTTNEHADRILTIDCTDVTDYRGEDTATISTVDTGTEEITFTAVHSFVAGDHVYVDANGGTLPAGLSGNTSYFVSVVDADTVTLSATPTGGAVDLTSTGSGSPIVEGVGNILPGFWKFDHLSSPIASNTTDTLTGEDGQQNVWTWHQWFLGGNSYEILNPVIGWDMPGAGQCYGIPESYTWRPGLNGEESNTAWVQEDFTTDFGTDANQLNIDIPSGETDSPFANDETVQFTTTGTLPSPLTTGTVYWVVNRTATTIEVSATEAGAPITLTSDGTGTHTAYLDLRQAIDGVYVWNMTYGATNGVFDDPGIIEDKVWFEETGGYDGSAGMGTGVIANRPASPALLNTAYWATDTETLWAWRDTTGNGSGDTWVNIYQEYAYPHPLRTSTTKIITNSITVN